jgi:hypothetical protein
MLLVSNYTKAQLILGNENLAKHILKKKLKALR